jgi:hypothetical protein
MKKLLLLITSISALFATEYCSDHQLAKMIAYNLSSETIAMVCGDDEVNTRAKTFAKKSTNISDDFDLEKSSLEQELVSTKAQLKKAQQKLNRLKYANTRASNTKSIDSDSKKSHLSKNQPQSISRGDNWIMKAGAGKLSLDDFKYDEPMFKLGFEYLPRSTANSGISFGANYAMSSLDGTMNGKNTTLYLKTLEFELSYMHLLNSNIFIKPAVSIGSISSEIGDDFGSSSYKGYGLSIGFLESNNYSYGISLFLKKIITDEEDDDDIKATLAGVEFIW